MWEVKNYLEQVDIPYRLSGENYFIQCLWHTDQSPSLSIRLDGKAFYCFGCGEKGDFTKIVKKLTPDINLIEFVDTNSNKRVFTRRDTSTTVEQLLQMEEIYLAQFNLYNDSPQLLKDYTEGTFQKVVIDSRARVDEYNLAIAFPVYYYVKELGRDVLIEIQKRNLLEKDFDKLGLDIPEQVVGVNRPKWQISKTFKKSQFLYGLEERFLASEYEAVAVTEGLKDAGVGRYFFPEYLWVSTFGCKLSETQAKLIRKAAKGRPVIMAYDNDGAGFDGVDGMINELSGKVLLRRLVTERKDVGELRSREEASIDNYIWNEIDWQEVHKLRNK